MYNQIPSIYVFLKEIIENQVIFKSTIIIKNLISET